MLHTSIWVRVTYRWRNDTETAISSYICQHRWESRLHVTAASRSTAWSMSFPGASHGLNSFKVLFWFLFHLGRWSGLLEIWSVLGASWNYFELFTSLLKSFLLGWKISITEEIYPFFSYSFYTAFLRMRWITSELAQASLETFKLRITNTRELNKKTDCVHKYPL